MAKVSASLQETSSSYVTCCYCNASWNRDEVAEVFRICVNELGVVPQSYKVRSRVWVL